MIFSLWGKWIDELASGERDTEQVEFFLAHSEAKEGSPLAMMYEAFVAGVGAGLELYKRIEESAK